MNDIKQFFNDLHRDLSDRHLLLPAIGLIVAIIAVPMLLKSEPAVTPPPAAPAVGEEATEVRSAVLTSDPGIRDYSQRLEALKEKNPFVQQFAEDTGPAEDPGAVSTEGTDVTGSVPDSTPATGATDTGATDTGATDTGGAPVPGSDGAAPTEPTQPDVQTRFFAPRVDVTFGKLGDTKQIDDVRHFDFLPNQKTPVVAFLGLGESADKAVFGVSNEVAETSGEGSCSPHEQDGCDLLILRVGQERMLKLVDGTTYRLKVLDTHFTRIPDPRDDGQSGEEPSTEG
jgi:hypothetical protein